MNILKALSGRPTPGRSPSERFRGKKLLLTGLLLALGSLSAAALPRDYYVDFINGNDNNAGTIESPWQGVLSPTSKINTFQFQAGDHVFFRRGCTWTGTLNPKGNGTSTDPIVFDAYDSGLAPVINGAGVAGSDKAAVTLWNKSYFTLQNFSITNPGAGEGKRTGIMVAYNGLPAPAGITTYQGLKILNNEIHHVGGISVRAGDLYTDTGGIYMKMQDYQGSQTLVKDFLLQGNIFHDNRCIGFQTNAPVNYNNRPDLWAKNMQILDNVFTQGGADHIVVNGADAPLIEGNAGYDAGIIANPDTNSYIAGMWVAVHTRDSIFQFNEVARTTNQSVTGFKGDSQAFDVDIVALGDNIFQYNYTHENEGGVVILMYEATKVRNLIYRYNLSVNDGRKTNGGSQFAIIPTLGSSAAYLYNNVFYSTRPEGIRVIDKQGISFFNNIFYTTYADYAGAPTYSNNCYFGHVPDVNDPYKLVADPKFVGPLPAVGGDGDLPANTDVFKLQANSPCINAGKTMASNGGRDFFGYPLYSGSYADIGMHEVAGGSLLPPGNVVTVDDPVGAPLTYGGSGWTHTPDTSYYAGTRSDSININDYVQCDFTATNVSIIGNKGPAFGKMNVSIDGGAPVLVDLYWPVYLWRQEIFRASGLSQGAHTVRATVAAKHPYSTWNRVTIDCFRWAPGDPGSLPGVATVDNAAATYSTGWTNPTNSPSSFYNGTRAFSVTPGSYLDYAFTGNGIRIYGTRNIQSGKLQVSVDGGPATIVNNFQTGDTYEYDVKIFEATGLSYGSHTLHAVVLAKDPASTGNDTVIDAFQVLTGGAADDVIVDSTDDTGVAVTGAWTSSTFSPGYFGRQYFHDGNTDGKSVRFTPNLKVAGNYEVYARWIAGPDRAPSVPVTITRAGGTSAATMNQQANGGTWISLGIFPFNAGIGGNVLISDTGANGIVIADAIRFIKR